MRCGSFSLSIPEGVERDSGHIAMRHETQYRIQLGNHGYRRCDAQVTLDGKDMGGYRINGGQTITLERAFHDQGRFTFFKSDSSQGQAAGAAEVAAHDRGLITVIFKPERKSEPSKSSGVLRACSMGGGAVAFNAGAECIPTSAKGLSSNAGGLSSGVTGLTGQSDQQFHTVSNLDYDPSGEVTISVRLVCDDYAQVRRLTPVQTPVPAPVE